MLDMLCLQSDIFKISQNTLENIVSTGTCKAQEQKKQIISGNDSIIVDLLKAQIWMISFSNMHTDIQYS